MVTDEFDVLKFLHTAPLLLLHVPDPLEAFIKTSSLDVGAENPPDPPDVSDQFAVFTLFQVPAPPTQNLSAMTTPDSRLARSNSYRHTKS